MGVEDPMEMTDEQVEDAKQFLIDHRDQFRSYAGSDADKFNLFKSGEVVIADGGRGSAAQLQAAGAAGRVGRRPRRARWPGSAASGSPRTRRTSRPPTS